MNSVTSGKDENQTICNVQMPWGTSIVMYTLKERLNKLHEFKPFPNGKMMSDREIHLRDYYIDKIDKKNPLSKITFYVISGQRKTTLPIKMYMPSSGEVEAYISELKKVIGLTTTDGGKRRRNKKNRKTRRR
jgi:hypothetical protein